MHRKTIYKTQLNVLIVLERISQMLHPRKSLLHINVFLIKELYKKYKRRMLAQYLV